MKHIAVSIAVHGLLIYWLLPTVQTPSPAAPAQFVVYEDPPIPVQKPLEKEQPKKRTSKSEKSNSKSSRRASTARLEGDLQKALRSPVWEPTAQETEFVDADTGEGPMGADAHFKAGIELPKKLERVWAQVRSNIRYHSDFYIESLQGDVIAKIVIGATGKLESLLSIRGPPELVEAVKMALAKALSTDFLINPLNKKLFLNLSFHFAILPLPSPVQEYAYDHSHLHFNIFGVRNAEARAWQGVKGLLSKREVTRASEWNFSKSIEIYREACFEKRNPYGCKILIDNYQKLAMHDEVHKVKRILATLPEPN